MFGECHAHLFMNGYNYKEAVIRHKGHVEEGVIRDSFMEYKKRGITFIRDGGDALFVSQKAKTLAGEYGIDYRTPVFAIHKNGHYGSIVGRGFDTIKEYHSLVLEVRRFGGDFIKIMVSGIVDFGKYKILSDTPLNRFEIKEMIRIAHEEGFAVMVHANGNQAVLDAAEAGADSIEHGNYMDDECIMAIKENKVIWVPTIVTIKNLIGSGRFEDKMVTKIYDFCASNIQKAYTAGAALALGSDAGAYRVMQGQGIEDEWQAFCQILSKIDRDLLKKRLADSEKQIRIKFDKRE